MSKGKVVIGMSGGVDSSVAAVILKEAGFQVIGVTMKIWDGGGNVSQEGAHHACYGPGEEGDIKDAQKVAEILGIPFHIFDLKQEYKTDVLDYFSEEYLSGRTPNPCIRCNQRVKFGAMVKKIYDHGIDFDYFATGHYSRVEYDQVQQLYLLKKGKDLNKDQSYFLYSLSQEQLGHTLFPIGDYTKEEVRKIARDSGLGINAKPESQDFITGGYSFLFNNLTRSGPILNQQGQVLGQHRGIPFYTIGQRKGLGISSRERLYVTAIDSEKNAIMVGKKEDLLGDKLIASHLNQINIKIFDQSMKVKAKIRYHHKEAEVELIPWDKEKIYVKFREPQRAVTPGQAIVFYDRDIVVGGGIIEERI